VWACVSGLLIKGLRQIGGSINVRDFNLVSLRRVFRRSLRRTIGIHAAGHRLVSFGCVDSATGDALVVAMRSTAISLPHEHSPGNAGDGAGSVRFRRTYARGVGRPTPQNIEPRCAAHNQNQADLDFGRAFMDARRSNLAGARTFPAECRGMAAAP
jgi:hypothetical protein